MTLKSKITLAIVLSVLACICVPVYGLIPLILMIIYKEKEKNGTLGERQAESLLKWSYISLAILFTMFIIVSVYFFITVL